MPRPKSKRVTNGQRVREALATGEMSMAELHETTGLKKTILKPVLWDELAVGRITRSGSPRHFVYALPKAQKKAASVFNLGEK